MKVSFLAGLGPLVRDPEQSLRFYRDVLGLPLVGDGYMAADNWSGTRCFGQWTLEDVAESIFGTRAWPADIPVPQANLELDVESEEALAGVAANLRAAGYEPLVGPKKEPWNQSVVRGIGPEGFHVSTTYTPWLHESAPGPGAPATEGLGPGAIGRGSQAPNLIRDGLVASATRTDGLCGPEPCGGDLSGTLRIRWCQWAPRVNRSTSFRVGHQYYPPPIQ